MQKVIKFSKKGCSPCEKVESFLDSSGIKYETVDPFETEDYDLVIQHNVKTVPVTVLIGADGETITRKAGFNEKALQHLVDLYHGK